MPLASLLRDRFLTLLAHGGDTLDWSAIGQLAAKDVLKKTQDEWTAIVRRIGRAKLKDELASYKALMPKRDLPA